MDIHWKQELTKTSYQLLREAGYIPITDKVTGKQSYVFKLTSERYPRFHIYVEKETDKELHLHLHLDKRQHGFGQKLHDSEYNGENVDPEGERLKRWLQHFSYTQDKPAQQNTTDKEKGFLSKLFG